MQNKDMGKKEYVIGDWDSVVTVDEPCLWL